MQERLGELSIGEGASLREAMEAIDRGACEIALVLDGGGRLLGTLTDGDVRRAILKGADLGERACRYMQTHFTAVHQRSGRSEVLDLMRARTLEQIPILDGEGRLVGLHLMREIVGASPRPNWAVVMAGGRGERLRPLTDSLPKPMIKVAGRPILERIVLHLVGSGIRQVFISVNYKAGVIEDHFGDGSTYGCRIEYLREKKPLGTGGALSLLPFPPQNPLLILNGDLLSQFDVQRLLAFHAERRCKITVGVHKYLHAVPFGVLEMEEERVIAIREKPNVITPVNSGIYVMDPDLLDRIPLATNFPITTLIEDCLERGEQVGGIAIDEEWMDVGHPSDLSKARGKE